MLTATFRVDASVLIGTGHVMRCVVLANALAARGGKSHFLMRDEPGHLADWVVQNGHTVTLLPADHLVSDGQHFASCASALERSDWLVVDHYGLDEVWEELAGSFVSRVLVIDDLANRKHRCHLLLDQNAGRTPKDYLMLVDAGTRCLMGPDYALMDPAFRLQREHALARRQQATSPRRLLISMGGVDQKNLTGQLLTTINDWAASTADGIDVVLGRHAPHLAQIRSQIDTMRVPTRLHVDTRSMAQLLSDADWAIGAGGVSALERCVVALPTIIIAVADNQVPGSLALERAGAVRYIGISDELQPQDVIDAGESLQSDAVRQAMSRNASAVCDGGGADRVAEQMEALC